MTDSVADSFSSPEHIIGTLPEIYFCKCWVCPIMKPKFLPPPSHPQILVFLFPNYAFELFPISYVFAGVRMFRVSDLVPNVGLEL